MPCYDSRSDVRIIYEKGVDPAYQKEAERLSKLAHDLTVLLCAAGRARHRKEEIPVEVLNWWQEHCKLDALHGEPWDK